MPTIDFEEIFDKAEVGIALNNPRRGTVGLVNARYAELMGYSPEELRELKIEAISAEDPSFDQAAAMKKIRRAREGDPQRFDWLFERKDGSQFWGEVVLKRTMIGEQERLLAFVRDINERVELTQQLEAQKDRFETLHSVAHDIVDSQNVREAYERTVGAAEQVLNFEMCTTMVYEDGWLVPKAMSSGAPEDGARPMRPDEGMAGWVFQSGEPVVTDDIWDDAVSKPAKESYRSSISVPIGELGVFQAVATDPGQFSEADVEMAELLLAYTTSVVNRLQTEAELERQNERLDEFAGIVSHDLRNPLNVATGRLELAREDCDSEHLEPLARAHERMDVLIEDVLSLARTGESIRERDVVELSAIVQECWRGVETADATLDARTGATVRADETRLRQLLENLIQNAVEHGGWDVTVTVGDLENGFFVEDDGPGIPEEDRETVFEPGYSTSGDGTGYGLRIVEQIADAHGWDIDVIEGRDGGARFELTGVQVH